MTPAPLLARALRRIGLASAAAVLEGRSPHWPALERDVVKEEWQCRACGATAGLEVHHVRPFHLYPELELTRANLMVLCRRCHWLLGHGSKSWSDWIPTAPADAAAMRRRIDGRLRTREG
jgi:5-methylcytosine-specific restriction enzyme A